MVKKKEKFSGEETELKEFLKITFTHPEYGLT